jgi:hypothetical protein
MQTKLLSISQVAALLGIRKHRIEYAIVSGYLAEPMRFVGKRVFDPAEVRAVAAYFGKKELAEQEGGEPCSDSST